MFSRTKQPRTEAEIDLAARRGAYGPMILSVIALLFSGLSLYETILKQPCLGMYAASRWQYARGPGASDEQLIVPVTISNSGAREGAALSLEITLERPDGAKKEFAAAFVDPVEGAARRLFAPISVPGRSARTAIAVFVPKDPGRPLVEGTGALRARITLTAAYDKSYGFLDDLFHRAPEPAGMTLDVRTFDIAALVRGLPALVTATPAEED